MTIGEHPSFNRPTVSTKLWRYTDLPKFLELLSSGRLWLANAEILANDDPYEGLPDAVQFAHRMWRSIDEVPENLRQQIIEIYSRGTDGSPEATFRSWVMLEEQQCIMTRSGRRNFYVNCWHAAEHESVAMWKIYGSPGAGVAIVTNGARLETALSGNEQQLFLGAVEYSAPSSIKFGRTNAFDTIMEKRAGYAYEQEVRLVHWDTNDHHDPLENFTWNEETLRFDETLDDPRPIPLGMSLDCTLDVLIERVIVSPYAPGWYLPLIERLRDQLKFQFPVHASTLLVAPPMLS